MTRRLIGRAAELEAGERWLDTLGGGPCGLVIAGDAGIGKTAIWSTMVERARERGIGIWMARAAEGETQAGLASLADLVALEAPPAAAWLPPPQKRALAALLGADVEPVDLRPLGTAVRALLERRSAAGPLVLAIDDAQWTDASSRRALEFALRRLTEQPVGVLATVRSMPGGDDVPLGMRRWLPEERLQVLRVGPLSLAALRQLVLDRTGQALSRPTLTRLERACQGNPLLALEIVSAITRSGPAITVETVLPVPADVRQLAFERLAGLPDAVRGVVELLSALGRPDLAALDRALAGQGFGVEAGSVDRLLAAGEAAGLLELEDGVRFRHPLLGAAVYESMDRPTRQALHRRLSEVVEDPEERARHLALVSVLPDENVAAQLEAAAERAIARGAPDATIELLSQARRLTPDGVTDARHRRSILLAQALWDIGEGARSGVVLEDVLAELQPGPDRAVARLIRAVQLSWDGRVHDAIAMCRLALEDARGRPGLEATAHLRLCYFADADIPLGREHAQRALEILRDLPPEEQDPDLLACALLLGAELRLAAGEGADTAAVEEAAAILPASDSMIRSLGFHARGIARERLWIWAAAMDDIDGARRQLSALEQHDRDAGLERSVPIVMADLADLACIAGDLPAARRHAAEAMDAAGQPGTATPYGRLTARLAATLVAAHAGEIDDARAIGHEVLRDLGGKPDNIDARRLRAILGRAEISAGRPAEALAHLEIVAAALADGGIADPAALRYEGDHIESLVLCGRLDDARARLAVFDPPQAGDSRPWRRAVAARSHALLAAAGGVSDTAVGLADEAVDLHEALGMPVELGRALLLAGRLHRGRKAKRAAADRLSRAAQVFEAAGALA
ncbi:MAG: AAA family ATPase, partial [Gemmatimonadales bacterium]|nr:AAA family ATPase [Gemmatimonadales bacterium]